MRNGERFGLLITVSALVVGCGDSSGGGGDTDAGTDPERDGGRTDAGTIRDAAAPPDAEPVTPGDPGAADVRFDVDTFAARHTISPYVYGTNMPDWDRDTGRMALVRLGGNRWTAYNWENNASNAGSDWYHQNDSFLGGGETPGGAIRAFVDPAHDAGAAALITVPIAGYVAADKDGDGDVAGTPDYLNVRFHESIADKPDAPSLSPDLGDGVVYQEELVHWAEETFDGTVFYSLDNEPDLWDHTHARIRTSQLTYAELVDRSVEYATAIRATAPDAKIFGPVHYGWQGMIDLQSAPDASGTFVDHYLAAMREASDEAGARLLDVLDVHWYPEARGGGVRITGDDASDAVAAARVQAPRSLWDPDYVEDSWIARDGAGGAIALLPWLREKIDAGYAGTRIAITEYYYGGGDHVSGGIAQADVLGIFGREGLFAATLWHLGATDDRFIHGAFALYRDYDGSGGRFGDLSVEALTDDIDSSAVYASVDSSGTDRVVLVAINRTGGELGAGIAVTHATELTTAAVYQLTAASPDPAAAGTLDAVATNAFRYDMPPLSASVLILTP